MEIAMIMSELVKIRIVLVLLLLVFVLWLIVEGIALVAVIRSVIRDILDELHTNT